MSSYKNIEIEQLSTPTVCKGETFYIPMPEETADRYYELFPSTNTLAQIYTNWLFFEVARMRRDGEHRVPDSIIRAVRNLRKMPEDAFYIEKPGLSQCKFLLDVDSDVYCMLSYMAEYCNREVGMKVGQIKVDSTMFNFDKNAHGARQLVTLLPRSALLLSSLPDMLLYSYRVGSYHSEEEGVKRIRYAIPTFEEKIYNLSDPGFYDDVKLSETASVACFEVLGEIPFMGTLDLYQTIPCRYIIDFDIPDDKTMPIRVYAEV